MLNRFLRFGASRAVDWFLNKCYERGEIEWLTRIAKGVRSNDWEAAVGATIICAINLWRDTHPDTPLFQHQIFDSLDSEVAFHFIKEGADDPKEDFLSDMALEIQEMTTRADLKDLRKQFPRRSARLAAKRAAKC